MSQAPDIRPLIPESSTSESTTVEVTMNDLRDGVLEIPDYQRDSDQWDEVTKSLLIESVINNLSVPAFFFEVVLTGGVERNQVVDGQQRITTLNEFYKNKFRLVDAQEAPYISPHHAQYASKTMDELPLAYQQAFKKYRLTVIKLRNLGDMRLEVFRRINQGGTPLSGQDIRLAYYGENSPSLAFIRLVGVHKPDRQASKRFVENAKSKYGIEYPWKKDTALEAWSDWWEGKELARGQAPSESFLWALIAAQYGKLNDILKSPSALNSLNVRFNKGIDEALDAFCAQLGWQDKNAGVPASLFTLSQLQSRFFPYYEGWIDKLLNQKGPNLNLTKNRMVSSVIGASHLIGLELKDITDAHWDKIVDFIRRPKEVAESLGVEWPQSKGRWDGQRGYFVQFNAVSLVMTKITGK
jgi:hypothetical protein